MVKRNKKVNDDNKKIMKIVLQNEVRGLKREIRNHRSMLIDRYRVAACTERLIA
jgi:hypothetical protein